jgi:hypothetical protein
MNVAVFYKMLTDLFRKVFESKKDELNEKSGVLHDK